MLKVPYFTCAVNNECVFVNKKTKEIFKDTLSLSYYYDDNDIGYSEMLDYDDYNNFGLLNIKYLKPDGTFMTSEVEDLPLPESKYYFILNDENDNEYKSISEIVQLKFSNFNKKLYKYITDEAYEEIMKITDGNLSSLRFLDSLYSLNLNKIQNIYRLDSPDSVINEKLNDLKLKIISNEIHQKAQDYINDGIVTDIDDLMVKIVSDDENYKVLKDIHENMPDADSITFKNNDKEYSVTKTKFNEIFSLIEENKLYNEEYEKILNEYISSLINKGSTAKDYVDNARSLIYGFVNEEIVNKLDEVMKTHGYEIL